MVEVRTVLAVTLAAALTGGCKLATDHVDPGSPDASAGGSAADAAPGGGGDPADGAPAATGLLTVSASAPQVGFGEPIDFSAGGDADWVHWGLDGDVAAYNHRAGVAPSIGNYVQLGDAALLQTNCCIETGFSWSDGTPAKTATNAIGGVYVDTASSGGDGFQFSVPADTTPRTLLVYAGNWCVREKLQVTLSDASAPSVVDTSFDVPTAQLANAIYTIAFQAGSPGQTLEVALTVVDNHCTTGDLGEVHLFAAAVR
jgi:hypothetical protein